MAHTSCRSPEAEPSKRCPTLARLLLGGALVAILNLPPAHAGEREEAQESDRWAASGHQTRQSAQSDTAREFAIPEQALAPALAAFAEQSGYQVSYPPGTAEGLRSGAVRGRLTPEEALSRLLDGTGLIYRLFDDGSVTLARSAPAPAGANVSELGPVVVSVTRTETPVSQLTRSVSLVDREDIREQRQLDRNLGDILSKKVPGLGPSTESLSSFGQTLRGRDFLTLIDGVPQSTPLRAASRDLNTIDANAIERIEVIRGGTAAYGFGATGGLVNIITRRPEQGAFNAESEAGIRLSTEHLDDSLEWHTDHRASGRVGETDYLVSGSFVQRNSFFDADGDRIPPDPMGVQGGLADTNEWNLLGKLGHEFDDGDQRLELTTSHFRIRQDSDYTFGTGDPTAGIKTPAIRGSFNVEEPGTTNTLVNLDYSNRDVMGSELKAQAYYGNLDATFAKFPGFSQTEVQSDKIGARSTIDTPANIAGYAFNVIWGADYLHDETVQKGLDGPTIVPEMEQDAIAGFAELELPVFEWGLLRAGVRHEAIRVDIADVVNRNGIFVNGGRLTFNETLFNASAVAFLTDDVELYGGFSQGFSVADIGRAIRDGTATEAESLKSEAQKVDNFELGIRARAGSVSGSLAGFFSRSENGTTFDTNLDIVKQPERIWGIEATADAKLTKQLSVGGTFTWTQGVVDLDDDGDYEEDLPSTRVPPIKITGYVGFQPFAWWQARLQALYSGHRSPDSSQFGGAEVDDYLIVDLISAFDVGRGTLRIGIENLLNEDYFPLVSQASATTYGFAKGPGRTVAVSYSLRW